MSLVSRQSLWSACLGNLFEHYDTALFGFLSPLLAPLIFPQKDPMTALILTYMMIPLGKLARPLGSLVFGYIGDTYGGRYALFLTLMGMAMISGCIACSPTYQQIGIFAPLIFCFGRIAQNFLAAGETMGCAVFLLENTSEKRHDILSGFYNATTMGGHLLASFGVFLIVKYHYVDIGWRLLYVCGCLTALFGCLLRHRSSEKKAQTDTTSFFHSLSQIKQTLWAHKKVVIRIAICAGFGSASYSMALVLMNGLIPLISPITKVEVMKINTYLLVFDFCALPFFGWIASKVQREKLMLSASLGVALTSIPLFMSLEGASLIGVILVRVILVLFGVAFFAPFHAWANHQVSQKFRYGVISFGYALGYQTLGSPTAALALWCFKKTQLVSSIGWYWMALGILSSFTIILSLKSDKVLSVEKR